MTRLFREGRTETVRSCTVETCAFVRSMLRDETVSGKPWSPVLAAQSLLGLFPLHLCLLCSEGRTAEVAQSGGREAPEHVPHGDDGPRDRPSPLLSLRGVQVPGRRFCLPQGGMSQGHSPTPTLTPSPIPHPHRSHSQYDCRYLTFSQ